LIWKQMSGRKAVRPARAIGEPTHLGEARQVRLDRHFVPAEVFAFRSSGRGRLESSL